MKRKSAMRPGSSRKAAGGRHLDGSPDSLVVCLGKATTRSAAMRRVLEVLARLAPTDVTVTLIGETGTGKDVLAHAIHEHSRRAAGHFVVFDCGSVAPSLAESELLGHERGAFTGAVSGHAGAFERAHGGTLFLDEIGELPLELQPRLLRVLESRRVQRVGGVHDRPIDVRIVAATNRDLTLEVAAGKFRSDLYFRLAAALVPVPALRERLEDLPLLVSRLLADIGRSDLSVADSTLAAFRRHAWLGNIRELKNTLAYAIAFVEKHGLLEPNHLHFSHPPHGELDLERLPLGGQPLDQIERAAIRQTLEQTDGNRVQAARVLGIAVSTLYEKLKKYDLLS